jgi:hypothetical protein
MKKTGQAKRFVLQLDGSMDISDEAQLVMFMQVQVDVEVLEHILFCKSVQGNTGGRAVFEEINDFFIEQKIK